MSARSGGRKARAELRRGLAAIDDWLNANGAPDPALLLVARVRTAFVDVVPCEREAFLQALPGAKMSSTGRAALARTLRAPLPGGVRVMIIGRHAFDAGEARFAAFTSPGGAA